MTPLNYNHLYYFFVVAKEGSIVAASEKLNLTPQTISGQISKFEETMAVTLFHRQGKRLIMTESGQMIFQQAKRLFQIGDEIKLVLAQQQPQQWTRFSVGITDVVPKSLALRLLKPILEESQHIRLICREGDQATLLGDLAVNKLDCLITDQPLPTTSPIKAFNHSIAHSGLTFFAASELASELSGDFPRSLDGKPFLLPGRMSLVRDLILSWFDKHGVAPEIVAELDDSALLKAFGKAGYGVFAAPTIIADELVDLYKVRVIGETQDFVERFYAISPERRVSHPALKMLLSAIG